MQSTTVAVAGKGSNPKTTLYVGGLEESVNEATLHSAFIPFGDIKDVSIPMDHATGKHRGFGFVEFEDKDDAVDAIDNMHNAGVHHIASERLVGLLSAAW
jgi:peptidyl-prolyl isomerase E (cyclophilin E)